MVKNLALDFKGWGYAIIFVIFLIYTSCGTSEYAASLNNEIVDYHFQNVDTLVDIGCGDGFIDRTIAHAYPNVFFILEDLPYDLKKRNISLQLKRALKNNSYVPAIEQNYTFIAGSGDSIPIPSKSAKLVLCRMTLHEFTNRDKMVNELKRILTNEGVLFIIEREPDYVGETDHYCKNKYLTKTEIVDIFKHFKLLEEASVYYDKKKINILKFSKKT